MKFNVNDLYLVLRAVDQDDSELFKKFWNILGTRIDANAFIKIVWLDKTMIKFEIDKSGEESFYLLKDGVYRIRKNILQKLVEVKKEPEYRWKEVTLKD